jgi:phage baseplate assembly protein W|tara:strand:+ start:1185 stop:1694 length:510 start_codon:yes stop_codon:yes gene_type:complete
MSKRDISFRSVGELSSDPSLFQTVTEIPYGIKTPLALGTGRSGIFEMHYDPVSQLEDNLKNLILTNKGERLCNYNYGANLRPLTLELSSLDDFDTVAMESISQAVISHMPFIELSSFSSDFGGTSEGASPGPMDGVALSMTRIDMRIKYNVPRLRIADKVLSVSIYCAG